MWETNLSLLTIKRADYIFCKYCNIEMKEQISLPLNFALDKNNPKDKSSYAFDMWYVCPICGLMMPFGVPIPKEFYERYREVHKTKDPYDET